MVTQIVFNFLNFIPQNRKFFALKYKIKNTLIHKS